MGSPVAPTHIGEAAKTVEIQQPLHQSSTKLFQSKSARRPSTFDSFTLSTADEVEQFQNYTFHQLMAMKEHNAMEYALKNPDFKFMMLTVPKQEFKSWLADANYRSYDRELADKKGWSKHLITGKRSTVEDVKEEVEAGVSFGDFVSRLYLKTGRLFLPTQLTDSVFGAPESILVVFREYPFAKY